MSTIPTPAPQAAGELSETLKTVALALLVALVLRVGLFQPFTIPSASMEPNLFEGDYVIVSKFDYGWSRASLPFSRLPLHGRLFGRAPARGDVLVFLLPRDERITYIKRLVGLPGDRVQVRGGQVFVNDQPIQRNAVAPGVEDMGGGVTRPVERFVETLPGGRRYLTNSYGPDGAEGDTGVYVVPPHCLFMMGDNRDNSLDSRFDALTPPGGKGSHACGWDPALDRYLPMGQAGVGFVPEENVVGRARLVLLSWRPGASLYRPWTWLSLRPGRFLHGLP